MLHITFAGHRKIFDSNVRAKVDETISALLKEDNAFEFYSGGMGEFDALCEAAVRSAKRVNGRTGIRLIYVPPYMTSTLNAHKDFYGNHYDEILISGELESVHYKAAITRRNRWLVDHSDYLIAYVLRDHGGAYATFRYAQKKNCPIIRIE